MKQYPEIPVATGQRFREFDAYVFDKLDGSNIRAEWTRKRGWDKFGTRTRLVDASDEVFGPAIPLFMATLAEPLERIARKERWQHLVVFTEFFGPSSFAGLHAAAEPKRLVVFDAAADRRGLLGPRDFLDAFTDRVPTPAFLGRLRWTRGFVERVRRGEVEGVTFEGVVGKGGTYPHQVIMAKAKTGAWLERVKALYGEARAVEEGLEAVTSDSGESGRA